MEALKLCIECAETLGVHVLESGLTTVVSYRYIVYIFTTYRQARTIEHNHLT